MAKRDYYEILGVPKDADENDIKKSYRKMARQYHPDVNQDDPSAAEKFKEATEAYQVLSDAEKRAQYDRFGHDAFGPGQGFDPGQGFGDFSGFGGLDDIFDMMFGGGVRRQRQHGPERGADLSYELEVDFKDAVFGREIDLSIPRTEECPVCHGSGAEPGSNPKTCPTCKGAGQVQYAQSTPFGRFVNVRPCDQCGGKGVIIEKPCHECHARGTVRRTRRVQVKVPAGVEHGARLRLSGEGEAGQRGGSPGDLFVFIRVRPHPQFVRERLDLIREETISFPKASLGGTVQVDTLDGDKVELTIPAGLQSGSYLKIPGRGVPRLGGTRRGDLLVKVTVETPKRLSARQKELLRELAGTMNEQVAEEKSFFDKVKDAFTKE